MGHQVEFFLGPNDLRELEARLKKVGELMILHRRSDRPAPRILESIDLREGGAPWLFYYLVRPDDLRAVEFREVPAQGYWAVDVLTSSVVELSRCYFDGKILRRGRLYYTDGFYAEDDRWIEKPRAFKSWANRVFAAARKTLRLSRELSAYVGAEAEALRAGGVEFTSL